MLVVNLDVGMDEDDWWWELLGGVFINVDMLFVFGV